MENEQQTVTPKISRKSNLLTNLISILLLLSIVAAAYFAYKVQILSKEVAQLKNGNLPITNNSQLVTNTDSTADWKTYTSEKFNFSFEYPTELSYIYDQSDQYSEKGVSNAMILLQNFDGLTPREKLNSDFQIVIYIANETGFNLENLQGDITEFTINGIKITRGYTTQKWKQVPTVYFQSTPNKVAVQLSNPDSTNKQWFDQILSTFKFSGKNVVVSGMNTYSNSLLTFKYPQGYIVENQEVLNEDPEMMLNIKKEGEVRTFGTFLIHKKNYLYKPDEGLKRDINITEWINWNLYKNCTQATPGTLNGYLCSENPYGTEKYIFVSKTDGRFIEFTGLEKDEVILDEILSTFKFTN